MTDVDRTLRTLDEGGFPVNQVCVVGKEIGKMKKCRGHGGTMLRSTLTKEWADQVQAVLDGKKSWWRRSALTGHNVSGKDINAIAIGEELHMNTEMFVLTFDSSDGADAMLQNLKDLQHDDFIELLDAIIVTKDSKGKLQVRQPLEVGPGKGAAFGALTGAIVGMLGGPGGAIVGLVSGAVTGGAAAAAMESGLPQADIKAMAVDDLAPGGSALMVYVDAVWIDQIEQAAKDVPAKIARHVVKGMDKIAREKAAEVRKDKIDAAYKSWQAKIGDLRTSATALRHQADSGLKSDRDAIHPQLESMNATLHSVYKTVLQTLRAWQNQIDAYINELEAEVKAANADARADTNRRLTAAKEARAAIRTHVKDTLSARL